MPSLLLGFGTIGVSGMVIILIVVLIVFGPSKLPQLGEGVGKMLRGFKREMDGLNSDNARGENSMEKVEHRGDDNEIEVTPKGTSEARK